MFNNYQTFWSLSASSFNIDYSSINNVKKVHQNNYHIVFVLPFYRNLLYTIMLIQLIIYLARGWSYMQSFNTTVILLWKLSREILLQAINHAPNQTKFFKLHNSILQSIYYLLQFLFFNEMAKALKLYSLIWRYLISKRLALQQYSDSFVKTDQCSFVVRNLSYFTSLLRISHIISRKTSPI